MEILIIEPGALKMEIMRSITELKPLYTEMIYGVNSERLTYPFELVVEEI